MMRPATNRTRQNGTVRCAIYTRKSSEEGLEQKFNSRQAQGEACEAFISSQRHEGLVLLRANYDDRGFSGATMERPPLQRFLADITAGRVDIVVVYKIDRLTRSLADFAKIVEILDARGYVLCFGNPAVRDDDLDGALDPQLPVVLRQFVLGAVRARADRRPRPWQDRRLETEGDVDGRRAAARISGAGPQARHCRQRGGNPSLDLSPLCRTRIGRIVKGRARSPECQKQILDERLGPPLGRQAIRAAITACQYGDHSSLKICNVDVKNSSGYQLFGSLVSFGRIILHSLENIGAVRMTVE